MKYNGPRKKKTALVAVPYQHTKLLPLGQLKRCWTLTMNHASFHMPFFPSVKFISIMTLKERIISTVVLRKRFRG